MNDAGHRTRQERIAARRKRAEQNPYSAMHTGPGRGLAAVYGIFALAASARAGVQIIRDFELAPVAYSLSAVAAAVYILATVCLAIGNRTTHRIALISCAFEFVGVIAVGTLSVLLPEVFRVHSVWSLYGIDYGFLPLILPLIGLLWLRRVDRRIRNAAGATP